MAELIPLAEQSLADAERAIVEVTHRLAAGEAPRDLDDIRGSAVDIEGSVARELEEETGLTAAEYRSEAHWHCVFTGPAVAMIRILRVDMSGEALRERLEAAPDGVPRCAAGHPLKPDVVLFGELLPEDAINRAFALAAGADLLLCIGSSLEVHPVSGLPGLTHSGGGKIALVTQGPTPYDGEAAVKLDGDVVAELDAVLAALG